MYYAKAVVEKLKSAGQLVLYGAGLVAFEVANCLMGKPYKFRIEYCVVSSRKDSPDYVMGIPVVDLETAKGLLRPEAVIIIATAEKYQAPIQAVLQESGFSRVISLTFESDLWSDIRGNAYRAQRLAAGKTYLTLEEEFEKAGPKQTRMEWAGQEKSGRLDLTGIHIYAVRCHMDRPLGEDISRYFWEIPIQAGAVLTNRQICDVRDNMGNHISDKNRQYCELTALYWIWKNDCSKYAGLCHYRRHFELDLEKLQWLVASDIDVVLTMPILNVPSVREVYRHDHVERDWDVMLAAIHMLAAEYLPAAIELQNGTFYYGYNMFIARKEILNEYCAWLFPILAYCEAHCGEKEDAYQKRYIGFLAERLLSVYFLYHEADYRIVHARKHFISQ